MQTIKQIMGRIELELSQNKEVKLLIDSRLSYKLLFEVVEKYPITAGYRAHTGPTDEGKCYIYVKKGFGDDRPIKIDETLVYKAIALIDEATKNFTNNGVDETEEWDRNTFLGKMRGLGPITLDEQIDFHFALDKL